MSEIRDRVKEKVAVGLHSLERSLIKVVRETSPINCPWEELSEDDKETYKFKASLILSSKELAIVDREAKLPNYIGAAIAGTLKDWVKEIKDD